MFEEPVDDALSDLLRAGDPAAEDPGLSPIEQAAMRRRMLSAGREHRPTNGWLVPVTTMVALLALLLGLAWRGPQSAPPGPAEPPGAAKLAAATDDGGQQVQFVTESGTLVVWVLQPRSTS